MSRFLDVPVLLDVPVPLTNAAACRVSAADALLLSLVYP
jgi:hypothetical protein